MRRFPLSAWPMTAALLFACALTAEWLLPMAPPCPVAGQRQATDRAASPESARAPACRLSSTVVDARHREP